MSLGSFRFTTTFPDVGVKLSWVFSLFYDIFTAWSTTRGSVSMLHLTIRLGSLCWARIKVRSSVSQGESAMAMGVLIQIGESSAIGYHGATPLFI